MPKLCMIFEALGPYNAIGKIAMCEVEAALDAGWEVSAVAHRIDESLKSRVDWLELYNPPRGFAVKWLSARHFIKKAMGDPARFDLIHGHQPQIADLCDIFECHYLTRAALERGCRDARTGLRGVVARLQESIVLRAEDRCYQNRNPGTRFVFGSEFTRNEFARLYGMPQRHSLQTVPSPPWNPPSDEERTAARHHFVGDWNGPVLGFLGGMDERKGCRVAQDAVAATSEAFLVLGGSHGEQVKPPAALLGRFKGMGLIEDVDRFYAAIDVLLVPSVFEPFGLVCFEAAARGVPTIATQTVGALPLLASYGVGKAWTPGQPLMPLIQAFNTDRAAVQQGCHRLINDHKASHFKRKLIDLYQTVRDTPILS